MPDILIDALAVAVVPPPPRLAFVTVANTVPPEYGSLVGALKYTNWIPYVIPIPVSPEAVMVNGSDWHMPLKFGGVMVSVPMVGQLKQPGAGPSSENIPVFEQPPLSVTVIKYDPAHRPD